MMRRHLLALLLAGLPWTPAPHYAITPSFSAPLTSSLVPTRGGVTATFSRADATTCATVLAYCSTCNAADGLRLITVPANEARFYGARRVSAGVWSDTFADGSLIPTTTRLGYLSEGSRANLILRSQEFDNASWTKAATTVTANSITGPDGTATADSLIENSALASHTISQSITKAASSLTYTQTVYAKANTRTRIAILVSDGGSNYGFAGYDLSGGQIGYGPTLGGAGFSAASATISATTVQGFYRCAFTITSNTAVTLQSTIYLDNGAGTAAQATSYTGDGTSGVYLWGAQLEQASFASSYIATTTASVTRASDSLTYPSAGIVANAAGSSYAEVSIPALATADHQAIIDLNSVNYALYARTNSKVSVYDGTTELQGGTVTYGTLFKGASTWSGSAMSVYKDGAGTAGTFDGSMNVGATVKIGASGAATAQLYGTVRNVRLYTRALTAAQISTIGAAP